MTAHLLQAAITAVKSGQQERGRDLLLELVEQEPRNEAAWLWLSAAVDDLQDQIIALENALSINPHRTQARTRLAQLQEKVKAAPQDPIEELFTEAKDALRNGRRLEARNCLLDLVEKEPTHERAWWELSRLVDSVEDQIIALENVLQLNPYHPKAQERLTQLQAVHEDHLALGRRYEEQGDLQKAITAYEFAAKQAPVNADRLIGKKRLEAAKAQLKLSKVKTTPASWTWARLTVGPPFLFGLLILIQSGLNPLYLSPLSCLGGIAVLAGSLLVAGSRVAPSHPLWQRFLGYEGLKTSLQPTVIGVGLVLLLLPFIFFTMSAIDRLEMLRATFVPIP